MRIDPHSQKAQRFIHALPAHYYDADVKFVFNILNIFSCIRESYQNMADKPEIDEKVLDFPGFDAYNEPEFYDLSRRLAQNGFYNLTLGEHASDAERPTLDKYQRMIACWNEMGQPKYPFSKEIIEKLLDARFHDPKYSVHTHILPTKIVPVDTAPTNAVPANVAPTTDATPVDTIPTES